MKGTHPVSIKGPKHTHGPQHMNIFNRVYEHTQQYKYTIYNTTIFKTVEKTSPFYQHTIPSTGKNNIQEHFASLQVPSISVLLNSN